MNRVPLLVGTAGALKGERFQVTEGGLTIGRDPDCSVVIDDPGVSRQHARVLLHNAAVWVQDAGSRNGVFVNGRRVTRPRQLGPGDELTIGKHVFTVELVSPYPDPETSVSVVAPPVEEPGSPPARLLLVMGVAFFVLVAAVLVLALR